MLDKILKWILNTFFKKNTPPVNPPVVVPETPTDPAPANSLDAVDHASISWDEPAGDVGSWAVTAKMGECKWTGDGYSTSKLDGISNWPRRNDGGTKPTVGNWWLIAKCSDGKLHGSTIEWLGPDKRRVVGKKWDGGDAIHGLLGSWRPVSGEKVYGMVSTCARAGVENGRERSNIVEFFVA